MDTSSSSSQNTKHKHADQPAKQPVTSYRIHVLPLLHRCGHKQLILKKCVYMQGVLCSVKGRII